MANNLTHDGLQKILAGMTKTVKSPVKQTNEEQKKIQADWNKLRKRMTGLK